MRGYILNTTEEICIELYALQRYHASASTDYSRSDDCREFHRQQASTILRKIRSTRNNAWTWERFIARYKKNQ